MANGPQRIRKEGTTWHLTLLCFGYTVVQCERMVVLQSAEMRNFSAAECRKVMRGNLRNVPHLIFCKLPLDNFPHSAICIPQNTHALPASQNCRRPGVRAYFSQPVHTWYLMNRVARSAVRKKRTFCPTPSPVRQWKSQQKTGAVHHCGDLFLNAVY